MQHIRKIRRETKALVFVGILSFCLGSIIPDLLGLVDWHECILAQNACLRNRQFLIGIDESLTGRLKVSCNKKLKTDWK